MPKKYIKFLFAIIFSTILLCGIFSYFLVNKSLAAGLEVKTYPTIAGKTVTAETKLPDFMVYLFNAGMILGFGSVIISLALAGVMYILSPIDPGAEFLSRAKDRVSGAISGLLVLILTYLIITTINPQLSVFKPSDPLETPQISQTEKTAPGVYLYKDSGCSNKDADVYASNVGDLGSLRKDVNSVKIVPDSDNDTYYFSILYETINFQGKCQYINPDNSCQRTSLSASSASIYKYNFDPNGDGVYFYRKSYFNQEGGYLFISNDDIGDLNRRGPYANKLDQLQFIGVPEEEQDCIKYDDKGKCAERAIPTLAGENISSIKIRGDYLVLLTYAGPKESCEDVVNTSCQEFPTPDDINKTGPQQIKWEEIRNYNGVIPNCLTIIPI